MGEFLHEKELCPWTLETINLKLGELCKASEERFIDFLKEIHEATRFVSRNRPIRRR